MGVNSVTRVSGPPRHAGLSRIIRTPDEASREKLRGVVPNGRESAEVLQLFDDSFDCLRASLRQVRVKARRTGARFGLQRHTGKAPVAATQASYSAMAPNAKWPGEKLMVNLTLSSVPAE